MKKLRYAGRDQIQMEMLSLDQQLPSDHLAREIWAYVETLDLGDLLARVETTQGEAGAPAFDPRTLLGLWVYATVESVGSARRLARLVVESLPYRWIAGGDEINYHTLSDFRVLHADVLDRLLAASVAVLAREGRVDLEDMTVAHDGLRVRASAGRGSMHRRPALEKALELARERVLRLKEEREGPGKDDEPKNPRQRAAQERAARERAQRLAQALRTMEKIETRRQNQNDRKPSEPRASSTDPEAVMLRMANGGKDPAHNLQFTTEVRTRAITAVTVADRSSDTGMLLPAMENHRRAHARLPSRVMADAGFLKYADIGALEAQGCDVLMPDRYGDARGVRRPPEPLIARWRERMKTQKAKEEYKLRSSTVEWSNARVRQQGLLQLTVRGRAKVLALGLWHALAHNILRTLALRKQAAAAAF
jgi:transposase